MKTINCVSFTLSSLLLFFAIGTLTAQPEGPKEPFISVDGVGEVKAVPDIVVINFGIETTAKEAKAAQEENAHRTNEVLAALRKTGVTDKNIQTTILNLSPRYEYGKVKQVLVEYVASKNFEIRMEKIDQYGSVLQAVMDAGVNQMSGVRFDHSKRKELEEEALKRAVLDARRKADIMAAAAGQKVGGVLSIEGGAANTPQPVVFRSMKAQAMAAAEDQLAPGESAIRSSVNIRFKLSN